MRKLRFIHDMPACWRLTRAFELVKKCSFDPAILDFCESVAKAREIDATLANYFDAFKSKCIRKCGNCLTLIGCYKKQKFF